VGDQLTCRQRRQERQQQKDEGRQGSNRDHSIRTT
jgi:hypothetical protein